MKATEKKQLLLYRLDIAVDEEHSDSHYISILLYRRDIAVYEEHSDSHYISILLYRRYIAVYAEHSDSHFISILSLIRQYCHTKEIIKLVFYHILSSISLCTYAYSTNNSFWTRVNLNSTQTDPLYLRDATRLFTMPRLS